MARFFAWIKTHKIITLLLLIILYLVYTNYFNFSPQPMVGLGMPSFIEDGNSFSNGPMLGAAPKSGMALPNILPPVRQPAPQTDTTNRMVVTNSNLSLQVANVPQAQQQIISTAQSLGGYMVSSNLSNPQDSPTATVVVRIPGERLNEALDVYRKLAVKVVSENLSGEDVTDQYVDNQARLDTLTKTKTKFEDILTKATAIQDILDVQRQIIDLQSQIDNIKGNQKYLDQTSKLSLLTIYLATDDLSLPYAPSQPWRADVIFKEAVRSLIGNLRNLASLAIWLAVYSVVIIPAVLIIAVAYRRFYKKG